MKNRILDCYIRVSTTEQEKEGHSLKSQEQIGKTVAEKLGLEFRLRNEGSRSSTIHYRPVLAELKDDIEKGRVKNVWYSDRSRIFRDSMDSMLFNKQYVEKFKVNVYGGELPTLRSYDSPNEN